TRAEDGWFRTHLQTQAVSWCEVQREPNPRRQDGPDVVYQGVESPRLSVEGYRVLWYRSSQKAEQDSQQRRQRLDRAYARLETLQQQLRARWLQAHGQRNRRGSALSRKSRCRSGCASKCPRQNTRSTHKLVR